MSENDALHEAPILYSPPDLAREHRRPTAQFSTIAPISLALFGRAH